MRASVIIPLWNGASIIADCLDALYTHSGSELHEVICVDNASTDNSAAIVAEHFPQVRLQHQPVNLGFAGGVNQGMDLATGDLFVLLNQDCLVHENWLSSLIDAFNTHANYGILGGMIFNADGSINHSGAYLREPDAYGVHTVAHTATDAPVEAEYVTGALFAVRRAVLEAIGPFDEGFYPAYYEEADYCARARAHGFQIASVPGAQATHHFTSRQWREEPLKHSINQHYTRYRFVAKHHATDQLTRFFAAEKAATADEMVQDQTLGRLRAARRIAHDLATIGEARERDLDEKADTVRRRLLQVAFDQLASIALQNQMAEVEEQLQQSTQKLTALQREKEALADQIFFHSPRDQEPDSRWRGRWRMVVLRTISLLSQREHRLLARLNTLHMVHTAQLQRHNSLLEKKIDLLQQFATDERS
ncbi:MAG: glycosyltransferase [Candidatus Promineifilaceae bacterium]|nr:glycosyltransferase [Candidatus Promineifilaceae bacterium]